ncbi:inactive serine protease PAMR1-like [Pecten maximus]|uniref:inactive serine protease PAMR1-like n=1 Tax=Pecten maximus TaxID=6579 RepID=UPI0014584E21|nr:inactive serine protease PAMR1-like [Pecten maximus]
MDQSEITKKGHVCNNFILFPQNVILPCTHSSCQQGSECHVLKNGSTVCVKTECVDSPVVANSTSLVRERKVGQQVTIVCNEGFILSGSPQRTCLGNGQWTGANITCIECGVDDYCTYNRAQDNCFCQGKNLLKYNPTSMEITNIYPGR